MRSVILLLTMLLPAGCVAQRATPTERQHPAAPLALRMHIAFPEPAAGRTAYSTGAGDTLYLAPEPVVSGEDVESARPLRVKGRPSVELTLTADGARKLAQATRRHLGRKLAIFVDDQIVCSPVISSAVSSKARITGDFSEQRAQQIAAGLNRR